MTGALLLSSRFFRAGDSAVRVQNGVFVGFLQGLAVFPGVSRSGSTIWAALVVGMSREEAFRFSFLLSVPVIIGAAILEAHDLGFSTFAGSMPIGWLPGAIAAFLSGLVSLAMLRKLVTSDRWWVFSIYCLSLGCIVVIYSLMGA